MRLFKTLMSVVIFGMSIPIRACAETKEEKIEIIDLPPVVKQGIMIVAPEATLKSVKKLIGASTRYQINYKCKEGIQYQITLQEDGKPMPRRKEQDAPN